MRNRWRPEIDRAREKALPPFFVSRFPEGGAGERKRPMAGYLTTHVLDTARGMPRRKGESGTLPAAGRPPRPARRDGHERRRPDTGRSCPKRSSRPGPSSLCSMSARISARTGFPEGFSTRFRIRFAMTENAHYPCAAPALSLRLRDLPGELTLVRLRGDLGVAGLRCALAPCYHGDRVDRFRRFYFIALDLG